MAEYIEQGLLLETGRQLQFLPPEARRGDGMTNCKYITKNGRCGLKGSYAYRHGCFGEDMCRCREPMTNAQKIRAMSDEELATFISEIADECERNTECNQHCYGCDIEYCVRESCLKWLQQPAEEDDHE